MQQFKLRPRGLTDYDHMNVKNEGIVLDLMSSLNDEITIIIQGVQKVNCAPQFLLQQIPLHNSVSSIYSLAHGPVVTTV